MSATSGVPRIPWFALNDKLVHVSLYSVLGLTLGWGRFAGTRNPPHPLMIAFGFFYGVVDEWHQSFVPFRSPEVADFVADAAGVTIGYLVFFGVVALVTRLRTQPST